MKGKINIKIKKISALMIMASLLLSVSFSAWGVEEEGYLTGLEQGRKDAEATYTWPAWGWGVAGAAGGYLQGIVGGGVFVFASTLIEPGVGKKRLESIRDESPPFQAGYINGFKENAQGKKKKYAAIGAGFGIIVLMLTDAQ